MGALSSLLHLSRPNNSRGCHERRTRLRAHGMRSQGCRGEGAFLIAALVDAQTILGPHENVMDSGRQQTYQFYETGSHGSVFPNVVRSHHPSRNAILGKQQRTKNPLSASVQRVNCKYRVANIVWSGVVARSSKSLVRSPSCPGHSILA